MEWFKSYLRVMAATPWGGVLSLIAGALWPLAFSPYGYWPVAFLCLLLLYSGWFGVKPWRAFWRGYLFGVGMFGFGVTWVHISIHTFGGVPLALSVSLTALFVAFLSLFPALAGYLVVRLCAGMSTNSMRWYWIAALPAAWVLAELVRGSVFSGFPWLNAGYSQTDGPLRGLAPILGVYGLSWAVALVAGMVAAILGEQQRRIRIRLTNILVGGSLIVYGLGFVSWTQNAGDPMDVALVQGNIPQDMKWSPDMRQPTIDLYINLSAQHQDADLIVWPETALPDFYHRQLDLLHVLGEKARSLDTDFLIGVLYLDRENDRYYNSMVSLGRSEAMYHKRHLVPFTEYLPLKSLFGSVVDFMKVPMSDFTPGGDEQPPLLVAGQPAGISICFEDAFGEEIRKSLPEATVLINVSNDAWFGGSDAPFQHLQMARMRALEAGRPLLRGTNTGVTAMANHKGEIIEIAPQFESTVLRGRVQPMSGSTPFTIYGNSVAWVAVLAVLAISIWRAQRMRPRVQLQREGIL